jgi:predicted AlkP superfamily phosphohydrolase/phosphomutase
MTAEKEVCREERRVVTRTERKVFAVGLDGGTLDLIRPWAEEGKLPTFARLLREGSSGELRSTIPPVTGPAWVSFMTGKNPGKHGVGDFLQREGGEYDRTPIDSTSIKAEPFWVTAGRQGKKVGMVNVPVTYPPYEVDGFLVSGLLTPRNGAEFTYPRGLAEELNDAVGGYRVNLEHFYAKGSADRFLEDVTELVELRTRAAQYLMSRHEWDFFMVHYIATDWVQHFLWHCMDPTHPRFDEAEAGEWGDAILKIYQKVDQALGELVEKLDDDTVILLMSDHGFGPFYKYIYLNNWLLEKKLLSLKDSVSTRFKYALFALGLTPSSLYGILDRLGLVRLAFKASKKERHDLMSALFLSWKDIDWSRTKAYSSGNVGQIFVNVKGREPRGVVEPGAEYETVREQIISMLGELRDPETGVQLIEHIYRREEVYWGEEVNALPDILMLPLNMEYGATGLSAFVCNQVVAPSFAYSGSHRMEGVFILAGDGVKAGHTVESADIMDVAPTIMHLLGLAVPRDMDGRVLTEALDDDFLSARGIEYSDEKTAPRVPRDGLSAEEAEQVTERLRGLGYVT